ncbi:hypothetical protein D3C81_1179700 [compost metagenome]
MFQANFGRVAQLLRRGTKNLRQPRRRHRTRRTDFALATHFGARDRSILFAQNPHRRCTEEVIDHVGVSHRFTELHKVVQYRRNDPCGAIGRRRDHAPARRVFFINRQSEQVDPLHRAQR